MADILRSRGARVEFYDPWVSEYRYKGEGFKGLATLEPRNVSSADLVMITSAHTNVDYGMVQRYAQAIFDTKNAMKDIAMRERIEVL